VIVLSTANPLDLTDVLKHKNIGAVLHVGQPGVNIFGVGDLLFGKKSPAGRMVQTVYKAAYADQISIFDFNMRPGPSEFPRPDCENVEDNTQCERGTNPGRTYRFYVDEPVVEFGFGLSYTTFEYTEVTGAVTMDLAPVRQLLDKTKNDGKTFATLAESKGDLEAFEIKVTNTGSVDADEVVLGFVTPPGAGENGVPLKSLFAFDRVHIKAGETISVYLYPTLNDFSLVNALGERNAVEGDYVFSFGVEGTSHVDNSGIGFVQHKMKAY